MSDKSVELIEVQEYSVIKSININAFIGHEKTLVVLVKIANFTESIEYLTEYLTRQEEEQFNRIIIPRIRGKFIIHRSLLRLLLSNILKMSPTEITIYTTQYGKPFIDKSLNHLGLSFNLSHSESYAMYAFGLEQEIGIDIEEQRCGMNIFETASLVLAPCEISQLKGLAKEEQGGAFLKLWTTKEAVSKAMGQGLSMNFQELVVGLKDSHLSLSNPKMALTELSSAPDYFAMLAIAQ